MSTTITHKRRWLIIVFVLVGLLCTLLLAGCDGNGEETADSESTSSTEAQNGSVDAGSGDVDSVVGKTVKLGDVRVTVNVLEATFQPALPGQRLSERTPSAPAAGESFYQAYVRVENLGVAPVRADATDFTCVVENTVVPVELTRSGPPPRSLLKNTSLDLILTFEAQAGFVPELRYNPPWYDGTARFTPAAQTSEGTGETIPETESTEEGSAGD